MADPIIEQVAKDLHSEAQKVTTSNGYTYDLTVERPKGRSDKLQTEDGKVIMFQGDPALHGRQSIGKKTWDCPFYFCVFAALPSTSSDSIDTRLNIMRADLEKQLMVDRTRSGLAIDTIVGEPESLDDLPVAHDGVMVQIRVTFRTNEDNPYSK